MLGILIALGLAVGSGIDIDAVVACMQIEDDGARLACYDMQLGRQPAVSPARAATAPAAAAAASATKMATTPATARVRAPAAPPEADFGLTAEQRDARAPKREEDKPVDRLTATVQAARATASGRWLVTLDNGQQWVQVEPSQRQYFFEGDPITIRKASLGSFLASGPHSGTGIRIRRVE